MEKEKEVEFLPIKSISLLMEMSYYSIFWI